MSITDVHSSDARVEAETSDGQPHAWIQALTLRLERIILGCAAQRWLDGECGPLPRNAAVVALPTWKWATSRISVGRKDRARDGSRLLMPVRITWSPSPLLVLPAGQRTEVSWRASGMGHTGAGRTELVASVHVDYLADLETTTLSDEAGMPVSITADPLPGPKLKAHLRKIVDDGKAAHWEAIRSIEPFVAKAVHRANVAIAAKITNPTGAGLTRPVLDSFGVDQVADEMLYGEADSTKNSAVFRLIDRCTLPATFTRVEPERYIKNALWSAADAAVRRKIGDPFIGDKIRAVQARGHYVTTEELIAAYNELYPRDRLAADRATAALSVTAAPTVFSFHGGSDGSSSSHADLLLTADEHYVDFSEALVDVLDLRRARLAAALVDRSRADDAAPELVKVAS